MLNDRLIVILGAILAVLCQILLAPNITISAATPNFLVVYTLLVAMLVPDEEHFLLAFVLGMISDLLGYGPVGTTAFLLIVASFAVSRLHMAFANGSVFVPLIALMVTIVVVEAMYALIVLGAGSGTSLADAFMLRALPITIYDCVLGILLYPILRRLFSTSPMAVESVSTGPTLR